MIRQLLLKNNFFNTRTSIFDKINKKIAKYLTNRHNNSQNSKSREVKDKPKHEVKRPKSIYLAWSIQEVEKRRIRKKKKRKVQQKKLSSAKKISQCPFCGSKNIIKRGKRKKKHETVQLFLCKDCHKTFTPYRLKGKHYPLKVIFDALSYYNLGYTLRDSTRLIKQKYDINVRAATVSSWLEEFKDICKYRRFRKFGKRIFSPHETIKGKNLYHRQIYKFRIHQSKLILLLQDDARNHKFWPLKEFLDANMDSCPHYLFKEGKRASEIKTKFDRSNVVVVRKNNFANEVTNLVLQAIKDNKLRHEVIQQFLLCNDSVSVASEVPVYLRPEDVDYMRSKLRFKIPLNVEPVLTGHIDLIQVRNGIIHIMDYKPNARKEDAIDQLTAYALALSRLTGLRLFSFKCAWFDENDYYEFFPLHVVLKKNIKRQKVSENQQDLFK